MTTATETAAISFNITNTESGFDLGTYEGRDELDAYNAMLEMAGCPAAEEIPSDLEVTEA